MSLLRIRCDLTDESLACQWVFLHARCEPLTGKGLPLDLPASADRVQLIVPAAQVLLARARLPKGVRRHTDRLLAFAVEDETLREPDANQVSLLGRAGDEDVLAVLDRKGLAHCMDELRAGGLEVGEVYCETLMLPWVEGEWSLAWSGREGFVRTSELEGAAMDCGDTASPPLSLLLRLGEEGRGEKPALITLYMMGGFPEGEPGAYGSNEVLQPEKVPAAGSPADSGAAPDIEAWERVLGIPVRVAGTWDWRSASAPSSFNLFQAPKRGRFFSGLLTRLRPAAWITVAAFLVHSVFLVTDWALLVNQQRVLRQQMETRFRHLFPRAALVDPPLQMRRMLAEARHSAGVPDSADFLPMIETIGNLVQQEAPGGLRAVSYDNGKITLEVAGEDSLGKRIAGALRNAGLIVEDGSALAEAAGHRILIVSTP